MQEHAYSNQPVIMLHSSTEPGRADMVRARLLDYFDIDPTVVTFVEHGDLAAIHFPGSYKDRFGPSVVVRDRTFAASSTPIFQNAITSDETGESLATFATSAAAGRIDRSDYPTPMSLFHADLGTGVGWATIDTFGMGRLYYVTGNGFAAVSNNIAALALAQPTESAANPDFWDSYYASGGGVGDATYVAGVARAPGGTTVSLSRGMLDVESTHSLEALLIGAKDQPANFEAPIDAALDMITAAKPFLANSLNVGLSGGRDSRLVTALALHAKLDFTSFTKIPPDLEGEIAAHLHAVSAIPFTWELRDPRKDDTPARAGDAPSLPPILERAEQWFAFTGGDNWPTHMRKAHVRNEPIPLGAMSLSGAFGDFTRGHYYTPKEAAAGDATPALERFHRNMTAIRKIVPTEVRDRGAHLVHATFDSMRTAGFTGFSALDMSFLVNRMRRQLPHPASNVLLPLLTPQMLAGVFWDDPVAKLDASGLRQMTTRLMPEWADVPYFHEAAVGTDPNVTNKVTIQPTYWEVNEADFLASVEHSIQVNDHFELSMDAVRSEISDLPEGRNRTNSTFEFMFWHAGGTALLERVNKAKRNAAT